MTLLGFDVLYILMILFNDLIWWVKDTDSYRVFLEDEKNITIAELNDELNAKKAENAKYKKAIAAAKASVGGLTSALTACKDTLESAM